MDDTLKRVEALVAELRRELAMSEEARLRVIDLCDGLVGNHTPERPDALCADADFGSYRNQVTMIPPDRLNLRGPIGVDLCLASEIAGLWARDIRTFSSCCGHGREVGYIVVDLAHREEMEALGYQRELYKGVEIFRPLTGCSSTGGETTCALCRNRYTYPYHPVDDPGICRVCADYPEGLEYMGIDLDGDGVECGVDGCPAPNGPCLRDCVQGWTFCIEQQHGTTAGGDSCKHCKGTGKVMSSISALSGTASLIDCIHCSPGRPSREVAQQGRFDSVTLPEGLVRQDKDLYPSLMRHTEERIRPALTPEQWKLAAFGDGMEGVWWKAQARDQYDEPWVEVCTDEERLEFRGQERHALAALCLHGQPFGFTHEDVKGLRETADYLESYELDDLRDLADRIEALLPPQRTR